MVLEFPEVLGILNPSLSQPIDPWEVRRRPGGLHDPPEIFPDNLHDVLVDNAAPTPPLIPSDHEDQDEDAEEEDVND